MSMAPKAALDIMFYCQDLDEVLTVRDYMKELLKRLFNEGEGFSGKRPFGNSGWEHDLVKPLVMAGAVPGTYTVSDDDGEEIAPEEYDVDSEQSGEQTVEAYIAEGYHGYDEFVEQMIDAL